MRWRRRSAFERGRPGHQRMEAIGIRTLTFARMGRGCGPRPQRQFSDPGFAGRPGNAVMAGAIGSCWGDNMENNITSPDSSQPTDLPGSRTRSRRGRIVFVYMAVAAATIVITVVVSGCAHSTASPAPRTQPLTGTATLGGTGLVPGVGGDATLEETTEGWRIELSVTGLSRRDNQQYYYEAWLENAAGFLVPVGTFNQGPNVTLWAGVSPIDFPTLTVTEQEVGRSQASSGKRALTGSVDVHR